MKFTVKTVNDQDKVANKVISGLYDSEKDQHVFWTVEKRMNAAGKAYNANVAYTGTYFGFTQANDADAAYDTAGTFATKAKQYGQNAELIWGDAANPENVLVAGAWGSANSKSGQAAGILDGKPATGTWSAKVNTKLDFDALLAKYNVEDYDLESQRESGVIADLDEEVKKALETIAANEKKIQEQDETIAKNEETIKNQDETIAAKDTEIEEAKKVIDRYVADLAATNATLAAQAAALEATEADLAAIEDSIKGLNDANLSNMITDYLKKTADDAKVTRDAAQAKIDAIELAYTTYTNSLDLSSASNTVLAAQAAYDTTNGLYKAAIASVEALTYTNDMVKIIFNENPKTLTQWHEDASNNLETAISSKKDAIEAAEAGFEAYKKYLQDEIDKKQKLIDGDAATVAKGYIELEEEAHNAYLTASNDLVTAQAAVDNFPTTLEAFKKAYIANGELMTLDQFIESKKTETTYTDDIAARTAYNQYCQEQMTMKSEPLESDLAKKKLDASGKKTSWDAALKTLTDAQAYVRDTKAKLETIEDFDEDFGDSNYVYNTFKKGTIEKLNGELADLEQQLADLEKEYAFWQDFSNTCTSTDKDALAKALKDATTERDSLATDEGTAKSALTKAQGKYTTQVSSQATALENLALLITGSNDGLNTLAGEVKAIRAKVDEYLNAPLGLTPDPTAEKPEVGSLNWMVEAAQRQIDAVERISESLKIDND